MRLGRLCLSQLTGMSGYYASSPSHCLAVLFLTCHHGTWNLLSLLQVLMLTYHTGYTPVRRSPTAFAKHTCELFYGKMSGGKHTSCSYRAAFELGVPQVR